MKKTLLFISLFTFALHNQAQTVVDIDGNVYNTVIIGFQTWMKENLRTTRFNDGTTVPLVMDNADWTALTSSGSCTYNNTTNTETINMYGILYNWYSVNTNNICPVGWHVPSDSEFTEFEIFLQNNGYNYDGSSDTDNDRTTNNKIAISLAALTNWNSATDEGSIGSNGYSAYRNKTGFTALPGGYRGNDGSFIGMGYNLAYWTSSDFNANNAWFRSMDYANLGPYRSNISKVDGFSVRCLKDITTSINMAETNEISIYPNPSKDRLFIKDITPANYSIEILNSNGKQIIKKENSPNSVDISNLKSGLYFIKILNSGKIKIAKFIKE